MIERFQERKYPLDLTSYDLIKAFAVVIMIVDHVGYYFFPDDMMLRAVGRLCVPVWFFLIGYAKSRDLGPKLWVGGFILLAANVICGVPFFPFNILFTMLAVRCVIDRVGGAMLAKDRAGFWPLCAILACLTVPTAIFIEYGTLAVIMALFGWFVRRRTEIPAAEIIIPRYFTFAFVSFVLLQALIFNFAGPEAFVLLIGTALVMGALYLFRPVTYPRLSGAMPWVLKAPLQILGRRTLEIYVLHLLLFKVLGAVLYPERFKALSFDWF